MNTDSNLFYGVVHQVVSVTIHTSKRKKNTRDLDNTEELNSAVTEIIFLIFDFLISEILYQAKLSFSLIDGDRRYNCRMLP